MASVSLARAKRLVGRPSPAIERCWASPWGSQNERHRINIIDAPAFNRQKSSVNVRSDVRRTFHRRERKPISFLQRAAYFLQRSIAFRHTLGFVPSDRGSVVKPHHRRKHHAFRRFYFLRECRRHQDQLTVFGVSLSLIGLRLVAGRPFRVPPVFTQPLVDPRGIRR